MKNRKLKIGRIFGVILVSFSLILTLGFFALKDFNPAPSETAPSLPKYSEEAELPPNSDAENLGSVEYPHVVAEASVAVVGDILIHNPILASAKQSDGSYNFDENYTYISSYLKKFDYTVANLEVTLGGTRPVVGVYPSGYPNFNSPDSLIDSLKGAGVDMVLTANNHSNDTRAAGFYRTLQVLEEKGMEYLGTRPSQEKNPYMVKEINGIKIGMACFTYSTVNSSGIKALNGIPMTAETGPLVSSFTYADLPAFYAEAQNAIAKMKQDGADYIMFYMHWGDEYALSPNRNQKNMAMKLCELGVDVIVGGHPHVIQPFETLKASNGNQTLCIYSTGNFISNQRKHEMTGIPTAVAGNTEDGIIFSVTFQRWNDGVVSLAGVNIEPVWVNMEVRSGRKVYQIIPLDLAVADWKSFGLNDTLLQYAKDSYNRTMGRVGSGLNAARSELGLSAVPTSVS